MIRRFISFFLIFALASCNGGKAVSTPLCDGDIPFSQIFTIDSSGFTTISLESYIDNRLEPASCFSDYVENIKYVRLETTSESIIPAVSYCVCSDKYIYLCSIYAQDNSILIFNHSGDFVKSIQSGRGPGELQELHGIYYSSQSNELIALSFPTELSFYSEDGTFLRKAELPFYADAFTLLEDGYLFNVYGFLSSDKRIEGCDEMLVRTDKNFDEISASSPYRLYTGRIVPLFPASDTGTKYYFSNFSGLTYFSQQDIMVPHYHFDVGKKYSMSYDEVKGLDPNGIFKYMLDNYVLNFTDCYETSTHLYLGCVVKYDGLSYFIDKDTDNVIRFPWFSTSMPLDFPICTYQDYFYSLVEASEVSSFVKRVKDGGEYNKDLITPETLSELEKVQADDNPVLIMYKMKHF